MAEILQFAEQPLEFQPNESFIRVATGRPEVNIADVDENIARIAEIYRQADGEHASIIAFPELSITGYSLGELVRQQTLLDQAENGLRKLAASTRGHKAAMVVGLPLQVGNDLYNCAAVCANGRVQGVVPKSHIPNYNEFYEQRWYASGKDIDLVTIDVAGQDVPFGTDQLFDVGGVKVGIEICEDLWVSQSPSNDLVAKGAEIIINPSASPEQVGRPARRRSLVEVQSWKLNAGYVYAGCDPSESTAEVIMGGHQLIMGAGTKLAETKPFENKRLLIADIDIDHLNYERRTQHVANKLGTAVVNTGVFRRQKDYLQPVEPHPFFPDEPEAARSERLAEIANIQAHALANRMRATHQNRLVLGLSGGLDSTLALLAAVRAANILGRDPFDMIHTLTMPGPASSDETQTDAQKLAAHLGVRNQVIPISKLVDAELEAIDHDGVTQDVTYENVQARIRTSIQFNYGNKNNAMVLGTGDLTEIALGFCTYNADQQSHYHINGSLPKTLVKPLVLEAAKDPLFAAAGDILTRTVYRPISPELTNDGKGGISQSTEEKIGPLELHDFYLTHMVRWGDKPAKTRFLANIAFNGVYEDAVIHKWLGVFISRFLTSQFKRENMPNGPKLGPLTLSPRGDWRMPPDLINHAVWNK